MGLLENQEEADRVSTLYRNLEDRLMANIIRHCRTYKQPIDSDNWLLQRMAEIGKLNREHIKIIAQSTGISMTAMERLLKEAADNAISKVEPGLQELLRQGLVEEAVEVDKSKGIKRVMKAFHDQAKDTLNMCNTTMLYKARDAYKRLVQDIAGRAKEVENKPSFLATMNKHATSAVFGAESRQQVVKNCIQDFNRKGIPAFVDKKGREWTPEAYVNMAMRNTVKSVAEQVQDERFKDYGQDLIEIDSHPGYRPKCAKDQGKIYSLSNKRGKTTDARGREIEYIPWKDSSYGEPDGILGINCSHHKWLFFPGKSIRRYFPTEDMEENNRLYKQTQVQRAYERAVRRQKRLCMELDSIGDEEGFKEASVKLKQKEAKLKEYVDKHEFLHRRKDREQVIGFDRSNSAKAVAAKKAYTKAMETDTIPVKDIKIPKSVGAKFKNYKVVDKTTGVEYEFAPGTRIQNGEVFAGKGTRHPLHEGVAEGLSKEFGGTPSKWQHAKGFGVLQDEETGEELQAEVHWFQEETVGKVKFKVKRWLDDEG